MSLISRATGRVRSLDNPASRRVLKSARTTHLPRIHRIWGFYPCWKPILAALFASNLARYPPGQREGNIRTSLPLILKENPVIPKEKSEILKKIGEKRASPEQRHRISREFGVVGHERKVFVDRLSNQKPIKRIFVMKGQAVENFDVAQLWAK